MIRRGIVAAVAAAVSWLVFAQGAYAEEAAAKPAGGGKYEEIVVTSQRTEESIQDVPIAVSAFTGEMMTDRQIISPSDLQMNAPNVSFSATNFGGSSFSIRGIGRLVIAASGENGVSIHLNDVAMPTNLPAVEFYDMERVEVLRGPQGTLFGKSATGGAINMITAKPQMDSTFGSVDGEYGNYDSVRLKGFLNLPVTETFALRFAGMDLQRDGFINNNAAGQVGIPSLLNGGGAVIKNIDSDIDGRDLYTYRITAAWDITDQANAWVMYSKFRENDDKVRITNQVCQRSTLPVFGCEPNGAGFDTPNAGATTGGVFGGLIGAVSGGLGNPSPPNAFPQLSSGFREMHSDFEPIYDYNEDQWTFGASYDFDRYRVSLGGGYLESKYLSQQDYLMDVGFNLQSTAANPAAYWPTSRPAGKFSADWTDPNCNFQNGTAGIYGGCVADADTSRVFAFDQADSRGEYYTVEAKVNSDFDGAINFLLGANYAWGEASGDYYVMANTLDLVGLYGVPALGFPQLYPTMFDATGEPSGNATTSESTAVFGELYFQATDSIKLTVGLRYNDDTKETSDTSALFNSLNVCTTLSASGAFNSLLNGCRDGIQWQRSTLASYYTTAFTGGAVAPTADALALANYYGVATKFNAALAGGPFAAINTLNGVPPVPGFNEQRALTGSPSEADWQETTGRGGVDWQYSDHGMAYAFYSRGYKPGGFNPPLNASFVASTTAKYTFEPEKVDAFEIGSKHAFIDGALTVNSAIFYYDYQGLQTTRIANNTSINDNMDAQIYGAELEAFYYPEQVQGLAIDFSYSYLHATVDGSTSVDPLDRGAGNPNFITFKNIDSGSNTGVNFVANRTQITQTIVNNAYAACRAIGAANNAPGGLCTPPGSTAGPVPIVVANAQTMYPTVNGVALPAYMSKSFLQSQGVTVSDGFDTNLDGNDLPNSPENKFHVGVAYTVDLSFATLTPRVDYAWQDESYAREFNSVGDEIDAWDQVNLSVTMASLDGRWVARGFVRNLQDEDNVTGKYLTSDTSGFFRNYFLTEPRIYGASVTYNFGEIK